MCNYICTGVIFSKVILFICLPNSRKSLLSSFQSSELGWGCDFLFQCSFSVYFSICLLTYFSYNWSTQNSESPHYILTINNVLCKVLILSHLLICGTGDWNFIFTSVSSSLNQDASQHACVPSFWLYLSLSWSAYHWSCGSKREL